MSHSTTQNFRPSLLCKLSQGENICFKYSGGSWPGVPRNLFFHSWYVAGPVRGAYMRAYDSNGNFKTFHCSKISDFSSTSQSTKEEVSEIIFQIGLHRLRKAILFNLHILMKPKFGVLHLWNL